MAARSRKGAPGILDVARRAGVSAATVSRAFTSAELVRPHTRERVLRAAEELGYIRDRVASGLQRRVSGSVGLVVPTIDNAIFAGLIEAFSARLAEHDRTMLIASHDYDAAREVPIVRSLLERRVDAVALVGRDHPPPALDMLATRDVPVVALWCAKGPPGIAAIGADNAAAARVATEHLLALGHRDAALLFPDTEHNDRARERLDGALGALRSVGLSPPPGRVVHCPYEVATAKRVASALLARRAPTAVVCGNDVIAHGVLYAAQRLGIDVPGDVSVVGIGDFSGSAAIEPGLTTVRLPARRIGRLAADVLVARLDDRDAPALGDVVIDVELVVRASTGPPRGAARAS